MRHDLGRMASDWLHHDHLGIKRADLDLDGFIGLKDFAVFASEFNKEATQ